MRGFFRRCRYVRRVRTNGGQILPENHEELASAFRSDVAQRAADVDVVWNMDETPVSFAFPVDRTVAKKGSKVDIFVIMTCTASQHQVVWFDKETLHRNVDGRVGRNAASSNDHFQKEDSFAKSRRALCENQHEGMVFLRNNGGFCS